MFSDLWHRIASASVELKPEVVVHKQIFRGDVWYVLRDPLNNRFFRLRAGAYAFASRLRLDQTVEAVWKDCLEHHPEDTPDQNEVVRLLGQLFQSNLITSTLPPDSARIFERFRETQQKEWEGRLKAFITPRFPVYDPDRFLKFLTPLARPVFTWWGLLAWLAIVAWGLKVAADHVEEIRVAAASALAPTNLPWLYVAGVILKLFHELAHGLACRVRGGEVHTLGILLMVFVPLPYVDATSSYAFRRKRDRIVVAAAGMMADFVIAALAVTVWSQSGDGWVRSLAYNIMFTASVSTLLFNINPLLRFDGYYILSDLLDIPNLGPRSDDQLKHIAKHYLFGFRRSLSPAATASEAWLLSIYGILAFAYKMFLIVLILEQVANLFFGLGIALVAILVVLWVVAPVVKALHYVTASPELHPVRGRAVGVTFLGIGLVMAGLFAVPAPDWVRAPGAVEAVHYQMIYAESDGYVEDILTPAGAYVEAGRLLLKMVSADLGEQLESTAARLRRLRAEHVNAKDAGDLIVLAGIEADMAAAHQALGKWEDLSDRLLLRSPRDGFWASPELETLRASLLVRGTELGMVVQPDKFRFAAVVSQNDASSLVRHPSELQASVRLHGQAGTAIRATQVRLIPAQQDKLPTPALGWRGGGAIEVKGDDPSGTRSAEPFYLVLADLEPAPGLYHHRTGEIRVDLPWRPLAWQWYTQILQMLQKRYRI
jgi:putative peptide zinc metalloprotease protein